MIRTFFWTSVSAVSFGYFYTIIREVSEYSTRQIRYRDSPFELQNILNYGFTFGLLVGIVRGIYGKPAIEFFIIPPKGE